MAITRKPKPQSQTEPNVDVEALILRGGSVAAEAAQAGKPAREAKPAAVVLRIPPDLLDGIEQARRTRPVKIPRHTWLLEAIVEKLQREAPEGEKVSR